MSVLGVKLSGLSLTRSRSSEPTERSFPSLYSAASPGLATSPKTAPLPPPPATGILLHRSSADTRSSVSSRPPTPNLISPDGAIMSSDGSDDEDVQLAAVTPSSSSGRKIRFAPLPAPKRARAYSTGRNIWLDPQDTSHITMRDEERSAAEGVPMSRIRSAPTGASGPRKDVETVDGFYTGPLLSPGGVTRSESGSSNGFFPSSLPASSSSSHGRSGSMSSSFSRKYLAPLVGLSRSTSNPDDIDDSASLRKGSSGGGSSIAGSRSSVDSDKDSPLSDGNLGLVQTTSRANYPPVAQRRGARPRAAGTGPSSTSRDPEFMEWDFGGNASAGHFRSSVIGRAGARARMGAAPDTDPADDDDGSGMAWLKKRRAEREQRAKEEAEARANANAAEASGMETPKSPQSAMSVDGQSKSPESTGATPSSNPVDESAIEVDPLEGVDPIDPMDTMTPDTSAVDDMAGDESSEEDEDGDGAGDEDDLSPEELAREEALAQEAKSTEVSKGTLGAEKYRDHEHRGDMRRVASGPPVSRAS